MKKKAVVVLAVFLLLAFVLALLVAQPILLRPAKRVVPAADAQRLRTHVTTLSKDFSPRDWEHSGNLERASKYITEEFARAGSQTGEQLYKVDRRLYHNV